MNLFQKIADVATGGLGTTLVDLVKEYFPPEMSAEKRAELTIALERVAFERERETNKAIAEGESALNERIREYEGTAKDLQAVPILGAFLIFARGAQRPIIGYATLYLDYMVFSGEWANFTPQIESAFWVINMLVFGFLFGERAMRNVMPYITDMMGKRNNQLGK